jgi:anti-sigma regulatory factor (Ser/Thr protein kinase)
VTTMTATPPSASHVPAPAATRPEAAPPPLPGPRSPGTHRPGPATRQTSLILGAVATAPRDARATLKAALVTWGLAHLSEFAEAITAELVTNAIAASARTALPGTAPQPVTLWASTQPGHGELCIRVWDPDPAPPPRDDTGGTPDLWAESGRGLFIVTAYSSRWSWYPALGGKYVWAAIPLRAQPPAN